MERLEAFEKMMSDILAQADKEQQVMNRLKAEGKTKTVTYRQYLGNRMMYQKIIDMYKDYGLIPHERKA